MKKIIDVDDNAINVMQVLDDGTILTISPKELVNYEEPKDEVPSLYPDEDTYYWYISGTGDIFERVFEAILRDCKGHFDIGSAFLTKEEAEFELERRKVIAKLKLFAENPKDEGWYRGVRHYYMYYDYLEHKIIIDYVTNGRQEILYFENKEQAQKAINFVGKENVKKYYLGVME